MKGSLMDYIVFSPMTTAVNVEAKGVLNGYKIQSVLHKGRAISMAKNDYYYIPKTRQVVSYRGAKAKVMVVNDQGKYNFQEKLMPRGVVSLKVDSSELHSSASRMFG